MRPVRLNHVVRKEKLRVWETIVNRHIAIMKPLRILHLVWVEEALGIYYFDMADQHIASITKARQTFIVDSKNAWK
jgi:hypothetical protein